MRLEVRALRLSHHSMADTASVADRARMSGVGQASSGAGAGAGVGAGVGAGAGATSGAGAGKSAAVSSADASGGAKSSQMSHAGASLAVTPGEDDILADAPHIVSDGRAMDDEELPQYQPPGVAPEGYDESDVWARLEALEAMENSSVTAGDDVFVEVQRPGIGPQPSSAIQPLPSSRDTESAGGHAEEKSTPVPASTPTGGAPSAKPSPAGKTSTPTPVAVPMRRTRKATAAVPVPAPVPVPVPIPSQRVQRQPVAMGGSRRAGQGPQAGAPAGDSDMAQPPKRVSRFKAAMMARRQQQG